MGNQGLRVRGSLRVGLAGTLNKDNRELLTRCAAPLEYLLKVLLVEELWNGFVWQVFET